LSRIKGVGAEVRTRLIARLRGVFPPMQFFMLDI